MKFQQIEKIHTGKFISRYNIHYITELGNSKTYEMISRDPDIQTESDLRDAPAEAVILIMTDASGERLLLNREFRLATDQWVYNFPAGLIDPGETPEQSAKRELREETGLELIRIDHILGISYSAVGYSNEKNLTIIGQAAGEFHPSTSDVEEIYAGWYTRAEVGRLIEQEPFAARTQAFCWLWAQQNGSYPFSFNDSY